MKRCKCIQVFSFESEERASRYAPPCTPFPCAPSAAAAQRKIATDVLYWCVRRVARRTSSRGTRSELWSEALNFPGRARWFGCSLVDAMRELSIGSGTPA